MSVWLALCFLVFLSLYLVCLQSVKKQSARRLAEQSVETGLFSLFSEYQPYLLEKYDLFYLDSSFQSGTEKTDELCSHLYRFINLNITGDSGSAIEGLSLQGVNVSNLVRATDADGAIFYQQAIEVVKEKSGVALLEDWFLDSLFQQEIEESSSVFEDACTEYSQTAVDYSDEDLEEEASSYDALWTHFALSTSIASSMTLSERSVSLLSVPSVRSLSVGAGSASGSEDNLLEKQLFISYLCDYMSNAQDMLQTEARESGYLDYQMEYILNGKSTDQDNLELSLRKILLMREGINYVFLLTNSSYSSQAETLATLLGGITMNEVAIQAIKQAILLSWAYSESLVEVRQLLQGNEISITKSASTWQVPLYGILLLMVNPGQYDSQSNKQSGLSYETCLRIFLSLQSAKTLAMRSLDIIEGELRLQENAQSIHVDHLIEQLSAQVWMEDIYLERTYSYE